MTESRLIDIQDLAIGFGDASGSAVEVVRDFSLMIDRTETIGIVGESGCGKSTVLLAMLGYFKPGLRLLSGTIRYRGRDLLSLEGAELERLRGGRIGFVPQNAAQSLTPTMRIGRVMREALRLHATVPSHSITERSRELLRAVRFSDPDKILARYPHELSGGQQQRIAIALALAGEPEILLLDEPTTALDVTTRAYVLDVLKDLRQILGVAMVYVSHDLGVISHVADRVAVMYAGELVELGPTRDVLRRPTHPYTIGLLRSIPRLRDEAMPIAMAGQPPAFTTARNGCAFSARCAIAMPHCCFERPQLEAVAAGQKVRCFRAAEAISELSAERLSPEHHRASAGGAPPALLELSGLRISYQRPGPLDRILGRDLDGRPVVPNLDLAVPGGQVLALVGESGSGKSTVLRVVAGLLPVQAGRATFDGDRDAGCVVERRAPDLLRRIQIIFQNPDDSLNPRHTVAEILASPLRLYFDLSAAEIYQRSIGLLEAVRLGPQHMDRFPAQLSGGEKQRVAIARGFAAEPELLLCDEITSALDVSVQAAVLDLLLRLKSQNRTTIVFVSHDLAVVRAISDQVAILYRGELCEIGTADEVFQPPFHPYTEALLSAVLDPGEEARQRLVIPDRRELPGASGCLFAERCHRQLGAICEEVTPPWQSASGTHQYRCHISAEVFKGVSDSLPAADLVTPPTVCEC